MIIYYRNLFKCLCIPHLLDLSLHIKKTNLCMRNMLIWNQRVWST